NTKTIAYILFKNNITHKNIKQFDIELENKLNKKQNTKLTQLNDEQNNFILNNKDKKYKDIISLLNDKYNITIHEKQIIELFHKNKIKTNSFYKTSHTMIEFIINKIKTNHIL